MNQWDEAAQKAADAIAWDVANDVIITPETNHETDVNDVTEIITKHFAQLRKDKLAINLWETTAQAEIGKTR